LGIESSVPQLRACEKLVNENQGTTVEMNSAIVVVARPERSVARVCLGVALTSRRTDQDFQKSRFKAT